MNDLICHKLNKNTFVYDEEVIEKVDCRKVGDCVHTVCGSYFEQPTTDHKIGALILISIMK